MTFIKILTSGLIFVVAVMDNFSSSQFSGSRCRTPKGELGICKPFPECVQLIADLRQRKVTQAQVRNYHCSFEGSVDIVCCKDDTPPPETKEPPNMICIDNDDICFDKTSNPPIGDGSGSISFMPGHNGGRNEISPDGSAQLQETTPIPRVDVQRKSEIACNTYTLFKREQISYHILNGKDAELGEFPHMAALGYPGDGDAVEFRCGGSLITELFILTAAHCASSRTPKPIIARMGVVNIAPQNADEDGVPVDVPIETITLHPQYTSSRNYHDIAIIKLAQPVQFESYLHPACLRIDPADPKESVIITGWGRIDANRDISSSKLLKTNLTAVPVQECNSSYVQEKRKLPNGLNMGHFCAYDPDGKSDACQGDSGGPLQIVSPSTEMSYIVGITSFGYSCGSRIPAVYARVANYLDWIENIVWGS